MLLNRSLVTCGVEGPPIPFRLQKLLLEKHAGRNQNTSVWKSAFAKTAVNYNKQKDLIKSTINRNIQKTPQNELCIPE